MNHIFIFPPDPIEMGVDKSFYAEYFHFKDADFRVCTETDLVRKKLDFSGLTGVYRGWMKNEEEYRTLLELVQSCGIIPLTRLDQYLATHHLPNWYQRIKHLTPETIFLPKDADLETELKKLDWPQYFIKDYVKSLKTSGGSLITDPSEAVKVAQEMVKYRGEIEGGFSIRKMELFFRDDEKRYFVLFGKPITADAKPIPEIVHEVAELIGPTSNFFSVDIVKRADGQMRVAEVGDGQVSDTVGAWYGDSGLNKLVEAWKENLNG